MKILVLESDPEMKETISKLLEKYSVEVIDLGINPITIGEGIHNYYNEWEGLSTSQMVEEIQNLSQTIEEIQNIKNLTSTKDDTKKCSVVGFMNGSMFRPDVMPIARCDFGTTSESKEPTWPIPKGRKDRNKSLKK